MALEPRGGVSIIPRQRAKNCALAAWSLLQDQFHTSCVGLVAEQGARIADASSILEECWGDGSGPGAVALLGFDRDFVATCLRLSGRRDDMIGSGRMAAPGDGGAALPGLSAWPPMVMFLPEDDPSIGECAKACRRMRSSGISVRLEVMRSVRSTATAPAFEVAMGELVDELDGFFAAQLTPYCPKLL